MKNLLVFSFFLLLSACVSTQISPQQRRAMQVKLFDGGYETVFRAFKTVLQDEGYIIKNQDMQGGLIVAHASKSTGAGMAVLAVLAEVDNYQTGSIFEVSVNLEKISPKQVESRVIIQKTRTYSRGGSRGNEILKPELYQNIYAKVSVEVERRKAQNK